MAQPSVAVIGGGVAGLAFARRLQELLPGALVVVFDTGKHAPGGRCSSKQVDGVTVDHAAQCFSARGAAFRAEVARWVAAGAVRRWTGARFGTLDAKSLSFERSEDELYVGAPGIAQVPRHLAAGLTVRQGVWIAPSGGLKKLDNGMWSVRVTRGPRGYDELGQFSAVVVAHNGKCAERLSRGAGMDRLHEKLRVEFNPAPRRGVMTLNSIYSLVARCDAAPGLDAALVRGSGVLSMVSSNDAKSAGNSRLWTLLSTARFAKAHKVPQEHLAGTPTAASVTAAMLDEATSLGFHGLEAVHLQLWGAANPTNVLEGAPCVWDADVGAGIVGDWLCSPSIEGAWTSGVALAEHLSANGFGQSVGLDACSFAVVANSSGCGDIANDASAALGDPASMASKSATECEGGTAPAAQRAGPGASGKAKKKRWGK